MKEKKKSWMHSLFAYAQGEKKLALSVILSVLSVLLGLAPFYCMYALICQFAARQAAVGRPSRTASASIERSNGAICPAMRCTWRC